MEPDELTLSAAAGAIQRGDIRAADLARALIRRHDAVEPAVRAMAHFDPDSLVEAAEAVDHRLAAGGPSEALAGVPIGVKDIFECAGMPCGYGIAGREAAVPARTASAVQRLVSAGAIVFGKTATTERAYLDPAPTCNPWNPEHSPGGSSSGSAAGVAARLFPAALGTQTAGSVIRPAAYCGVIGMTLTRGRVPLDGVLPLVPRFDTIGFFVRDLADAGLLLSVLSGSDGLGPEIGGEPLAALERPVFLGFARRGFLDHMDEEAAHHALQTAKLLAHRDAIVHVLKMPASFDDLERWRRAVFAKEAAWIHGAEFRARPESFGAHIGSLVSEGLAVADAEYHRAVEHLDRFRNEMLARIAEVDALILPSATGQAPRGFDSTGNPLCNAPWTAIGFPCITVPTGTTSLGLPLGLQIVGKPTGERFLLRMAQLIVRDLGYGCPSPPIVAER